MWCIDRTQILLPYVYTVVPPHFLFDVLSAARVTAPTATVVPKIRTCHLDPTMVGAAARIRHYGFRIKCKMLCTARWLYELL